jgi:hypothetical protein
MRSRLQSATSSVKPSLTSSIPSGCRRWSTRCRASCAKSSRGPRIQSRVDEIDSNIGEELWIGYAQRFSIKDLRDLAARTWHEVAPESFCEAAEEAHERRQFFISESGDMYRLDGWLDAEGGAA